MPADQADFARFVPKVCIQYLPTFLVFFNGEFFAEIEGVASKEEFEELCDEILEMQQEINQHLQA
jgi:hypothetical protein